MRRTLAPMLMPVIFEVDYFRSLNHAPSPSAIEGFLASPVAVEM